MAVKKTKETGKCWSGGGSCKSNVTWGLIVLLLGLYMLSKDMGWIETKLSFWTIIILIIGLAMVGGAMSKK